MKKKLIIFIALAVSLMGAATYTAGDNKLVDGDFKYAMAQVKRMLHVTDYNSGRFPRTTNKDGKLVTSDMYDWTPGFFPGTLWYLYEYSKDEAIKKQALGWTEKLEPLKTFTQHHDLGFMMYCSYGNAYRITGNEAYKKILIQSARSLSTRFSPVTGAIKSWNQFKSWHGNKTYYYPVIIDNMMNLELLYFASKATGDSSFSHIATTHALTAMKNQVRKDYSHFHVVCYDSVTGKVIGRETAQGYADNSTWSRGQAWGIYGFTMVYRETHDPRFLKTAIGMADFFLNNKRLPLDKVPYWDFDAQQKGYTPGINSYANKVTTLYRDASAAAITASALLELSMYAPAKKKQYVSAAVTMLQSLSSAAYRAPVGGNGDFLLMHCVGSIPHRSEIDEPLVYADYYFLEALTRYNKLMKTGNAF